MVIKTEIVRRPRNLGFKKINYFVVNFVVFYTNDKMNLSLEEFCIIK